MIRDTSPYPPPPEPVLPEPRHILWFEEVQLAQKWIDEGRLEGWDAAVSYVLGLLSPRDLNLRIDRYNQGRRRVEYPPTHGDTTGEKRWRSIGPQDGYAGKWLMPEPPLP